MLASPLRGFLARKRTGIDASRFRVISGITPPFGESDGGARIVGQAGVQLGIRLAVPAGLVAVGDEELVSKLKRIDDRQRGLDAAVASMQARRGVPLLALRKGIIHGIEDRITVLIQVLDVPPGTDPLTLLAERKPALEKGFEGLVVTEDVHAISRDGVPGAEFTEEHDLALKDGGKEHVGATRQFFVRGDQVFLLSASWIG